MLVGGQSLEDIVEVHKSELSSSINVIPTVICFPHPSTIVRTEVLMEENLVTLSSL